MRFWFKKISEEDLREMERRLNILKKNFGDAKRLYANSPLDSMEEARNYCMRNKLEKQYEKLSSEFQKISRKFYK